MKTMRPHWRCGRAALIFGVLIPVFGHAQDSTLNRLSAAEKAAGWILLFDGIDKDAHFRVGLAGTSNSWVVEEQAMASAPGSPGNEVFTKESYANFELSMEWKLSIKGNSGIFIRVSGNNRQCSGEEFAILDDVNGDDRTALGYMPGETAMPIKRAGADYDLYPTVQDGAVGGAYVDLAKPYDQWNKGTLWANGNLMEHWLNGKKVNDYEVGSPDWLERFKLSKYYGLCPNDHDTWARHPTGLIGMQDHGGGLRVWFRNIKIRPFVPGEKPAAPWISPAGGKFNAPAKVTMDAAIIGSTLRYTLDGSDPTPASPVYQDSLILTSSATLKARTYRGGFQAGDVATAVFTFNGTGLGDADAGKVVEPGFRQAGNRIRFLNAARYATTAILYGVDGGRRRAFAIRPGVSEFDLSGLHGLCLLALRDGRLHKLVLP
ncbi:MAG: hypothetical protein JWM16_6202 [Verrucomicrobiales bacterium]|nr:hypothetical protein [Verrucomicrobiales bacterium]